MKLVDGEYVNAHESRNKAGVKLTFYNEEMSKIDDFQSDLQSILINII